MISIVGLENDVGEKLKSNVREFILEHTLNLSKTQLHLQKNIVLDSKQKKIYLDICRRHLAGEPLAYIFGYKDFYKNRFKVQPGVLIPRPETELVVDIVLDWVRKRTPQRPQILDLGCGSGCIGLSLAFDIPNANLLALDISQTAVQVSNENCIELKLQDRCKFQCADASTYNGKNRFDIVVANPPYIAREDKNIQGTVKKFEPPEALFSNNNGFEHINKWANTAYQSLKKGGLYVFEIGFDQSPEVKRTLNEMDFYSNIEVIKDYSNIDRIFVCERK